jgi:hypothetical protein
MSPRAERLFELLPAIYRMRDAEAGSPLRALLGVMQAEHDTILADIEALYESWFIETAPEWVVPYIGELVGNRLLAEVAHSRRADVARTLYYRRRKGTLPMLEELARHVTGWGAHAVEFMELLGWTQNVNHLRYTRSPNPLLVHPDAFDRVGTVNVRNSDALDRLDGPWDGAAHTVDVRAAPAGAYRAAGNVPARAQEGWYGTRRIGFFLWRLRAYPLDGVPARRADAPNEHGWHFSPLGAPVPLFTDTRAERDPARLAREIHVPGPIRAAAFRQDIEAYRERFLPLPPEQRAVASEWYGPGRSVDISADGVRITPDRVLCKDLQAWARPPAGRVAVDVRRGRMSFPAGEEPADVRVRFAYGFSADIGGGPYDRRTSLPEPVETEWFQAVAKGTAVETLQQALAVWEGLGRPAGVIEIQDSDVYGGDVDIDLPPGGSLVIRAADEQLPSVRLVGLMTVSAPADGARLSLNGLLVEGAVVLDGAVSLDVAHCTLVPGRMLTDDGDPWFADRDSIVVAPAGVQVPDVTISSSITGPIRLPATARALVIRDSVVQAFAVAGVPRPALAATDDGDEPGPPSSIERSTLFGTVHVRELALASESIFTAPVTAQRVQVGCVRFSYVAPGSRTPRCFRCQPDLALEDVADPGLRDRIRARLVPAFTSERFTDPGYAQLRLDAALEIRTGAANGSEMGAFCALLQPQRESNLRTRLEEYLPFGLEPAMIYVT